VSDLALTPTRRRRLEQVRLGEIERQAGHAWDRITGFKVSDEINRMERAGWVERRPVGAGDLELYVLTDAGVAELGAEPVGFVAEGSVWLDLHNPGRRLKVLHVSTRVVQVAVTYSPAPDAFDLSDRGDAIPRREWTANRYRPESTPDGAS
jgi:UPF0288 family protein (methanogenesis marker protein 3)